MTFKEACDIYWKYYIALEDQLMETSRYVEFDYINNGKTYSMEFLKLFQAVCSEIDVVGKVLATLLDTSFKTTKSTGINEWWYYISQSDESIQARKCILFNNQELQPWMNFRVIKNNNEGAKKYILDETTSPKSKTPSWWNDYNKVKHNRTGSFAKHSTNYAKANLRNLFYAFAALFTLEVKVLELTRQNDANTIPTNQESRLFVENLSFYTQLITFQVEE